VSHLSQNKKMAQPRAVPMGRPLSSFATDSRLSQNKKLVQARAVPMGRPSRSFATESRLSQNTKMQRHLHVFGTTRPKCPIWTSLGLDRDQVCYLGRAGRGQVIERRTVSTSWWLTQIIYWQLFTIKRYIGWDVLT